MADPPATEPPGDGFSLGLIGPWQIGRKLGGGGQGNVHLVRHSETGQLGAAKLVRFSHGQMSGLQVRFDREVGALRKLDHPNIVRILDFSPLYSEEPWMVMEFVDGEPLSALAPKRQKAPEGVTPERGWLPWEREPLPTRRIAVIAGRIARAMGAAHGQNILHRDLKCENVMMRPDGEPVIVDFGLALHPKDESVTMTGFALGTPVACAPEVLIGLDKSTQLSDIFSIGVILYHLLTGDYPWGASSNAAALRKLIDEKKGVPTPMRTHLEKVDRELEAICQKCLELEPDRRFSSCVAVAEEIDRWLAGLPTLTRPPSMAGRLWKWARRNPVPAALVAACALGAGWYVVHLVRENARLALEAEEAGKARQREAQRLVWEAFSARQRRDEEGMTRAFQRFRQIAGVTEGWDTVEGILGGLLNQQAIIVEDVTSLACDAAGRRASGRKDGVIQIFDSPGNLIREFLPPPGTKGKVNSLVFTPSGQLVRASEGGGIHLMQPDQPEVPARWLPYSAETLILAGPRVIACGAASGGGDVLVLDAEAGNIQRVLPEAGYLAAAGGQHLVTATGEGVITVWDVARWVPLGRFGAGGGVTALAVCGDGRWAAWAGENQEAVHVKDLHHPQLPPRVLAGADSPVRVLAASGEELAAGCASGTVILWNPGTGSKSRHSAVSHLKEVSHIAWPAGADAPVTAGLDKMIRIHPGAAGGEKGLWAAAAPVAWTVGTDSVRRHTRGHLPEEFSLPDAKDRFSVGVSPDGNQLCTIRTSGQETLLEWLGIRGHALHTESTIRLELPAGERVLWALEGGSHLGRLSPGSVHVLNARTGAAEWSRTFEKPQEFGTPQAHFLLSTDGSMAAWKWSGGRVWMAGKSTSLHSIGNVSTLAPRPGYPSEFAVGLIDGQCGVLDASTGQWTASPVKVLSGPVRSLALAEDGHTMAVGGHLAQDGTGGGLTLIDVRQLALAGPPSYVLAGQQIASLVFNGNSTLGIALADGRISFEGRRQAAQAARVVPVRPVPASGSLRRVEWLVSAEGPPMLPSGSVDTRTARLVPLGQGGGGDPRGWAHTFVGLPPQVTSARLILSVNGSPGLPASKCTVRLGAQNNSGRWLPQTTLSAIPPGPGEQEVGFDLKPELISGSSGTLECIVSSAAPLTGMKLVIGLDGECAVPEGARKDGEALILDAPAPRAAALTAPLPDLKSVQPLDDAALWSAGGSPLASPEPGSIQLPAGAGEFTCAFDLVEDPASMQLALWLDFPARGLQAELNGLRIPRADAAPMAGWRHYLDSGMAGQLRRGRNTLKFTLAPAGTAMTVKISGGIQLKSDWETGKSGN